MGSFLSKNLSPQKVAVQPWARKPSSCKPRNGRLRSLWATVQATYLGKYLIHYMSMCKAWLWPSARKRSSVRPRPAPLGDFTSYRRAMRKASKQPFSRKHHSVRPGTARWDVVASYCRATRKAMEQPLRKRHSVRHKHKHRNAITSSAMNVNLDKAMRMAALQRFMQKNQSVRPTLAHQYAEPTGSNQMELPSSKVSRGPGAVPTPAPRSFPRKLSLWLPVRPDYPGGEYSHYLKHRIWSPQVLSRDPEPRNRSYVHCWKATGPPKWPAPRGEARSLGQRQIVDPGQSKFCRPVWSKALYRKSSAPQPHDTSKTMAGSLRLRLGLRNRTLDSHNMMKSKSCSYASACPVCCPADAAFPQPAQPTAGTAPGDTPAQDAEPEPQVDNQEEMPCCLPASSPPDHPTTPLGALAPECIHPDAPLAPEGQGPAS